MKKSMLSATLLALVAAGSAQAALLSDLFGGGSITAGDKLFDSFYLVTTGPQGGTLPASSDGRSFDASQIEVAPLNDDGAGFGIGFSVNDRQFSVTGDGAFAFADYSFGFRVRATDSSRRIVGASLAFDPGAAALQWTGDGVNDLGVYIKEAIGSALGGSDIGTGLAVEFSLLDEVATRDYPRNVAFGPVSELWVTKNLLVWSQDTTDTAQLLGFSQRFAQASVPEPTSYGLVGVALLAAGAAGRRRKPAH